MAAFQHSHAAFAEHEHDEFSDHYHDATGNAVWKADNVVLTTVGIDIGSSTSHFMFARVHMQRTARSLTSRFVVVDRKVVWRSAIRLTPYLSDGDIDAASLATFVADGYAMAGLDRSAVDAGAVILTGEALKRRNARAIAEIFSHEAGEFVCAAAGHTMECLLGAHGSGAVRRSAERHETILNVDVGGGTTKFALVRNGVVVDTIAVAVGARLIATAADGTLERLDGPLRRLCADLGIALEMGAVLLPGDRDRIVARMTAVLLDVANRRNGDHLASALRLTTPWNDEALRATIDVVSFSGGVAEYIYGREAAGFGDLGPDLGAALRQAVLDGAVGGAALSDPGEGIRATVVGASQFSVQVSGNTVAIAHPERLPLRDVPVAPCRFALEAIDPDAVTAIVRSAVARADIEDGTGPCGLAFVWHGAPTYDRVAALARGIAAALPRTIGGAAPLALLVDGDIGMTLGRLMQREIAPDCDLVAIDGLELQEFDFVDIGTPLEPSGVVPVTIKSLLF
jgi:ethanolamine utilization protein EutA (predicted chaperonin)